MEARSDPDLGKPPTTQPTSIWLILLNARPGRSGSSYKKAFRTLGAFYRRRTTRKSPVAQYQYQQSTDRFVMHANQRSNGRTAQTALIYVPSRLGHGAAAEDRIDRPKSERAPHA